MPRILLLLVLLATGPLFAQTSEADLKTRLVDKPLYLRGEWEGDKLKFDASGQLLGSSKMLPFTLSGMDVQKVKLDDKGLTLDGKRVGVEFNWDQLARVVIKGESIRLHIDRPAGGDYSHALDRVFATLPELVPTLPIYWQTYAQQFLIPATAAKVTHAAGSSDSLARQHKIGGNVSAPRVLSMPQPSYDRRARAENISGKILVYLQVDQEGKPNNIRILHPLGFGLDDMAVDAVSRYKFAPAKENGNPVRVEMNIEVAFSMTQ
jgi:TonB family protein